MPRRGKRLHSSISATDEGENVPRKFTVRDNRGQKMVNEVTGENNSRSEHTSETVESASTSPQGRHFNRQKRKRVDTENSACSETAPTNEASSLIDNVSNRESPELSCSICLGTVENRAFTDACYHTFCFECLVEWSRVRAVCPLCKKSFHSIIHSFRSYDDYKLYQVPTSYVSNLVNISSINNSEPLNLSRVGRFFNTSNPTVPTVDDADRMLALRRRVYTHSEEMELRGLWSSDGVVVSPPNQVSPAMFDHYPLMLERVRPWVLRDVAVIIGNGDVQYVAGIVLALLRHFPITSEDFYERLFPYFGLHTRRFLLELDAFARSPVDMTTYDARVVYSTGTNTEEPRHLPTEHVEDISSSDDSDIEIVTPTVVTSAAEPALDSRANTMTGHVVPSLLHCLQRTFQESLLMSLSFMNRQGRRSELDSPVPGPSGVGQAVVTDESDSVGSHAPESVCDAEERSNSPLVLSDADSDVMVVDVNRPARSPIHISSGEDDDAARQIQTRRRVKRRRRRERADAECRNEFGQSDGLTSATDCAAENVLQGDGELLCSELPAASHKSADQAVEPNAEERVNMEEQTENSHHTQKQPASHSSNVRLNDHSSAGIKLSSSKTHLHVDDRKVADTARDALHHAHPKRSRSANSVSNVRVGSLSGADDVKLLTCKKHISGHKSSKQKAREVAAEKKSAEVGNDSAEKSVIGEWVGEADGSHDLTDAGDNEQTSADLPKEEKVSSIGESSIACADFSSSPLPVRSSAEEFISIHELAADGQLREEMPVPSTSETCSLPALPSSDSDLENVEGSSVPTPEVTFDAVHPCLLVADENLPQCGASLCSNSYDVVQTHSVDVRELPKNVTLAVDCGKVNSCERETLTASDLSSDCLVPSNNDVACSAAEPVHPGIISSSCANTVITTFLPSLPDLSSHCDSCTERSDCSSEPSCNISVSATSFFSNSQMHLPVVKNCMLINEGIDVSDHQPMQNYSNDSLPVVPQGSESVLIADSSFCRDSQLNTDTSSLCTDTASSENWSLLPSFDVHSTASRTDFDGSDFRLTERTGSARSAFHDMDDSPASPNPVVNDSILSPVGIDSSDSDSEVEWLETGVSGRQRCISISSGCSSVVCSLPDDVESVLLDSDSMEMFGDELQFSAGSSCLSTESQYQTDGEQLPQVNSAPLPSTSHVASSADVDQVEKVMNSEQVNIQHEGKSHNNDAVTVGDSISEPSSNIPLYINPTADAYGQDTDTDVEDLDS